MRGMRKWKRWAVFLLLFVVLAVGGSRTAQAEMLDMTKYNDDLITVSKVPHGKAGNKISIKMTVHNNGSKGDNYLKTIRLAMRINTINFIHMMMTMMMTVIRIPIFHGLENIFHLKLIQIRLKKKELM